MESLYGSNWHEIELLLYLPLQKWTKKWKIREINHKKKTLEKSGGKVGNHTKLKFHMMSLNYFLKF